MKKFLAIIALTLAVVSLFSCASSLVSSDETSGTKTEESTTKKKSSDTTALIAEEKDMTVEKRTSTVWVADEIALVSDKTYNNPVYTVTVDAVFTNLETGDEITVPAFWNGGKNWIIRYALTKTGEWVFYTKCSKENDKGLHEQRGLITCKAYEGNLAIYQHGFLQGGVGKRFFSYADGTPFFYIGDTHWSLPMEDYSGYGNISSSVATEKGIASQFKYTVDYRVKQGFTVYQTQQLSTYNGVAGNSWFGDASGDIFSYGVNNAMLQKFKTLDKYFQYIAEAGLVNAHSQFSYPEELIEEWNAGKIKKKQLEMLCRYWVARYSAYPVMWTTTQEGDRTYYGFDGCTETDNPWTYVFMYIQKYDPYNHPATCHQENVGSANAENSVFSNFSGYSFFAAQYTVGIGDGSEQSWSVLKAYYNTKKKIPSVNYEGHYDCNQTGTMRARVQGWCSYLNGMMGYGYGVQPIWNIFWAEIGDHSTSVQDERETFTRNNNWLEGLESDGGWQMSYLTSFFKDYKWWQLVPCFNGSTYYKPGSGGCYSVATIKNELYVCYFYGSQTSGNFGKLKGMNNGEYTVKYFNPRTGKYASSLETTISVNCEYKITSKPDSGDWVIVFIAK